MKPDAVHEYELLFRALDANTHCLQRTQRRQTILACEEARDVGNTLRNASQHQRTMRDRFVAGDCQLSLDDTARACQILSQRYRHKELLYRARIRTEDAEQRGALFQLIQRLGDMFVVRMPLDINEENVVPFFLVRGS